MKIADPVIKSCPACGSEKTTVKRRSALESVLAIGSSLQKYVCRDCGKSFEAADRRRFKRPAKAPATP
jgi:transposase-like protein